MDERKSVYAVVSDEQMSRVRDAMEDVTSLVDSLRLGCEIAYRREPTQAEGDAHEYRHDQSMGASYGASECFVPMGGHHGWRCKCGVWVWGGPTVCQRCVDREAVKVALEWKAEADHLRKVFDDAGQGEHNVLALIDHYQRNSMEADERLRAVERRLKKAEDVVMLARQLTSYAWEDRLDDCKVSDEAKHDSRELSIAIWHYDQGATAGETALSTR